MQVNDKIKLNNEAFVKGWFDDYTEDNIFTITKIVDNGYPIGKRIYVTYEENGETYNDNFSEEWVEVVS